MKNQLPYESTGSAIKGYSDSVTARRETNDCVVRAFASAFDVTYDCAHKYVAEQFGRKPRKGTYYTASRMTKLSEGVLKVNSKKIITIGTAHNQLEYYFKKKQNCSLIFLSPIFITKKHSINKALGPVKFNLITSAWKVKFGCLGGLTVNNLKKTRLTFASSIGFQSLIYDKQKKTRLL